MRAAARELSSSSVARRDLHLSVQVCVFKMTSLRPKWTVHLALVLVRDYCHQNPVLCSISKLIRVFVDRKIFRRMCHVDLLNIFIHISVFLRIFKLLITGCSSTSGIYAACRLKDAEMCPRHRELHVYIKTHVTLRIED